MQKCGDLTIAFGCCDMKPLKIDEFEALAREKLSNPAYDYYASGARDEFTLRRNREAFRDLSLYYRVLADVSDVDATTSILGTGTSMPIAVAPTAFHRMAHPHGELATARAAGRASTLMTLSTLSNTALEDVADAAPEARWFQLYVYRDRAATEELVHRAATAGYKAIVLTVDAPLLGVRERDVRNGFSLPEGLTVANLSSRQMAELPEARRASGLAEYFADLLEPALTWDVVDWLVDLSPVPVVLKGVVRADDAARASDHGVRGIVVSNHGGRQLDTSPATIEALPHVVRGAATGVEVYVDGGVRRGTDVLKALALGARAVFLGRPILWGLAHDGEDGVFDVLELLRAELEHAMALAGVASLADIGPWLLEPG